MQLCIRDDARLPKVYGGDKVDTRDFQGRTRPFCHPFDLRHISKIDSSDRSDGEVLDLGAYQRARRS